MPRLEDLPKRPFYTTPDRYFDELPSRIQSRIATPPPATFRAVRFALQYALPLILIVAGFLYLSSKGDRNAEEILASVETEEIVAYLQDTGVSTDEIMETLELTPAEIESLESEVYELTPAELEGFDIN